MIARGSGRIPPFRPRLRLSKAYADAARSAERIKSAAFRQKPRRRRFGKKRDRIGFVQKPPLWILISPGAGQSKIHLFSLKPLSPYQLQQKAPGLRMRLLAVRQTIFEIPQRQISIQFCPWFLKLLPFFLFRSNWNLFGLASLRHNRQEKNNK